MQKPSFLFLLLLCGVAILGAYQASLGGSAATGFIRFTALAAYFLLCVSLIIGPLVVLAPAAFAQIVEPRRAVGIACFVFAAVHVIVLAAVRMGWDIGRLLSGFDPLISVPATLLLLALALTSSDYAIKTLGPGLWKSIQRLNYIAFALVTAHFISKANGLGFLGSGSGLNLAEAALLALGTATVALQAAGFLERRRRLREAAEKRGYNAPPVQSARASANSPAPE